MSVAVALAAGIGSALAYGAGTSAQHAAAYCGEVDASRLADLIRNPRWWAGTAGDVLGIVLQLVALSNGAVQLVQPLLVLSLPVAVLLRSYFGEPRPSWSDLAACGVLMAGVGLFFGLVGEPHRGNIIRPWPAAWTSGAFLVVGLLALLAVRHCRPVLRAVVFGAVAGAWFGLVGVLVEAASAVWQSAGVHGFGRAEGLVPLVALVVLAVGGYVLVQVGFQLGPLGASFPANLVGDPLVAVVLGATLLNESLPVGPGYLVGYVACLVMIGLAAVRLAGPSHSVAPTARIEGSATMTPS